MRRLTLFILLFVSLSLAARSGIEARSASATQLEEDLRFLTDSSLIGGRACGSASAQSAAFFLLRQFRSAGLRTTVQSFESAGKACHNIIAVTPGWYRKYILVSAYYDGIGTLGGEFYPGADSNSSAVAALLELSRVMPIFCKGDTGLIFVAFDAHNTGLTGSLEYVKEYLGEYRLSLMVNLDILGSSLVPLHKDRSEYLIALGGLQHYFSLERVNRSYGLDLSYDYYGSSNFTDLFYRKISDQRHFLERGVPCIMFTSGITLNTNRTTDTLSSLDIPLLRKRICFIRDFLRTQL